MTENQIIETINRNARLTAWVEADDECTHAGLIAVELDRSNGVDSIGYEVESLFGDATRRCLVFVDGDDASNVAWFRIKTKDDISDVRRAAAASRWGNRGESATIRVDKDAAVSLAKIPERDRRRVASDAVRAAVSAYAAANW